MCLLKCGVSISLLFLAGFYWNSEDIDNAANKIKNADKMHLESLYIHCGNSYNASTSTEREKLQKEVVSRVEHIQIR